MNIHEHQAKELFAEYSIPTPRGKVARTLAEAKGAVEYLNSLGVKKYVVKAQIHAGGRGKGGGVKLAADAAAAEEHFNNIMGMTLVTHQTGPVGKEVKRVWVEEATPPLQEMYLSFVLDRANDCVSCLVASEGGMDIEELAEESPEKMLKMPINFSSGWQPFHTRKIFYFLGLDKNKEFSKILFKDLSVILSGLYTAFLHKDCSLIEINPLAAIERDGQHRLIAMDAKVNFDSNALAKHKDILAMRDLSEEDPAEVEASKYDLNFIALDGTIGCMVNGAGLAMATMDIVKFYGAEPANFLDVGGGATTEKVTAALKIILKDPKVKGIFVNIFGGIMKCDVIAEGVIQAAKDVGIKMPLVVRLEGTNVAKGKELLKNSGLAIITAESMSDGAQKIVEATR